MSDLRANLIRVAYSNPELRPRLMQVLAATAMPESDFWQIVDGLGWGTRTTDYKAKTVETGGLRTSART